MKFPQYEVNRFKGYSSVVFGTFTPVCHHHRVSQCFHHSQRKPHIHEAAIPFPLSLCPWQLPTGFLSLELSILHFSYKENHRLYVLLCLASFTPHNVLKAYPYCSMWLNILPFYGRIVLHCVDTPLPYRFQVSNLDVAHLTWAWYQRPLLESNSTAGPWHVSWAGSWTSLVN